MQLDRGHIQYVKDLQRVRCVIQLVGSDERRAFEAIVSDAFLDPEDRQPAFWKLEGGETQGIIEYSAGDSPVRTSYPRYVLRVLGMAGCVSGLVVERVCRKIEAITQYRETDFKVIDGYDIVETYSDNIDGGNGCMRGGVSVFTNWYAENPDKVKMLVHKNKHRALLWTCDDGTKIIDRIYPNDGEHVAKLLTWAQVHGYLNREGQGATFYGWEMSSGIEVMDLTVTMNYSENGLYPWLDSFRFAYDGEIGCGDLVMRAFKVPDLHHDYKFQKVEGDAINDTTECERCEVHDVEEEMRCGCCRKCQDDLSVCGRCDELTNNTYDVACGESSDDWCIDCAEEWASTCNYCGDRSAEDNLPDDWHELPDGGGLYCPTCLPRYTCVGCAEVRDDIIELTVYAGNERQSKHRMCGDCKEIILTAISEAVETVAT